MCTFRKLGIASALCSKMGTFSVRNVDDDDDDDDDDDNCL